jgi:hypothetical protein
MIDLDDSDRLFRKRKHRLSLSRAQAWRGQQLIIALSCPGLARPATKPKSARKKTKMADTRGKKWLTVTNVLLNENQIISR